MSNLAGLYELWRDNDFALLYLQCVEMRKEKLGPDHADTLSSVNNLAGSYASKGGYDSALPLYLHCLEMRKEKLGPDHPNTLSPMNNLAGLYELWRDNDFALLYLQCVEMRKEKLGHDHPDTLTSMNNLATFV